MHTCTEQLFLARHLYPTGIMVWVFDYLSSMLVHSKLSCWCSSHQQQWRKSTATKEERKNWTLKKGTRYRKKQEMLIFQILPVSELLKFIRTQLTLYKQKYISLHSVFKFARGHRCCKQTVLGISSVVHGECIPHSPRLCKKLNSQSRI